MLTSKSAMKSVSDITHNNRNRHLVTQTLFIISLNIDFTTASLYFSAQWSMWGYSSVRWHPNLVSACFSSPHRSIGWPHRCVWLSECYLLVTRQQPETVGSFVCWGLCCIFCGISIWKQSSWHYAPLRPLAYISSGHAPTPAPCPRHQHT